MRPGTQVLVVAAALLAGCDHGSSVDFSPFEGLYQIDSHTSNTNACDAEGPAVAGSDPMLVIFAYFAANVGDFAEADSCSDAAACRQRAANPVPTVVSAAYFDANFTSPTADGRGLTGASFSQDPSGTSAEVTQNLLTKTGNAIRIEKRRYQVPCQMRDGACDRAATIAAASSAPCTELRMVTASFLERL